MAERIHRKSREMKYPVRIPSQRWSVRRARWVFACLAGMAFGAQPTVVPAVSQAQKPSEYNVKAAYLSNLGRFVEWTGRPKTADEAFPICVLGQDPFGPALDSAVAGENIGGSPLTVRRIARPVDAPGCRILFIASSEEGHLAADLAAQGTASVLTVSDIPDFVNRGGMVEFVLEGNKVRFQINLGAATRAGLTLSSDLLNLARAVKRSPK